MSRICGTNDILYDSWDLSMSTIPDDIEEENKLGNSTRLLLDEADRIELLVARDTFFGLPNRVRSLISKYKGIDKLYGKY